MIFSELNYIGVVAGAILSMVLGFLWYGPLFSKPWAALAGLGPEKIESAKSKMGVTYSFTFVLALITSLVMQDVVRVFGIITIQEALTLGFVLWAGLSGAAFFMNGTFEQKPLRLILIDSGYYLVQFVMLSVLFTFWV